MIKRLCCAALIASAATGCLTSGPPGGDLVPPAVLSITPSGEAVDPLSPITVVFTEPVDPDAVEEALVVVVADEEVDAAFLKDLDLPPLSSRRLELLVGCRIAADMDGGRLILEPESALVAGGTYQVVVSAAVRDLAGNPLVEELFEDERGRVTGVQTHVTHRFRVRSEVHDPPDPVEVGMVFTEVMANPAGTESEGEYLEVVNLGEEPIDLADWRLDDTGGGASGDLLGPCAQGGGTTVGPAGVALLVGLNFIAPPDLLPGAVVVCTDRSTVTSRGLKNGGGEILVLLDDAGEEVDRYGGWVSLSSREGCAAERLDPSVPDGPDNWWIPDVEPCRSPGWIR